MWNAGAQLAVCVVAALAGVPLLRTIQRTRPPYAPPRRPRVTVAVCILVACALGLAWLQAPDPASVTAADACKTAGLLLASLSTALLAVAWRALPRRADQRCPSCGHDLTGIRSLLCPECGRDPSGPSTERRRRRSFRLLVAGLALLGASRAAYVAPSLARGHALALVPTSVLIAMYPYAPLSWLWQEPESLEMRTYPAWMRRALVWRARWYFTHSLNVEGLVQVEDLVDASRDRLREDVAVSILRGELRGASTYHWTYQLWRYLPTPLPLPTQVRLAEVIRDTLDRGPPAAVDIAARYVISIPDAYSLVMASLRAAMIEDRLSDEGCPVAMQNIAYAARAHEQAGAIHDELLQHPNAKLRRLAVGTLITRQLDPGAELAPLHLALADPDASVSRTALAAVIDARRGTECIAQIRDAAAAHPENARQALAAYRFANYRGSEAIQMIHAALESGDRTLIADALEFVMVLQDARQFQDTLKSLQSSDLDPEALRRLTKMLSALEDGGAERTRDEE